MLLRLSSDRQVSFFVFKNVKLYMFEGSPASWRQKRITGWTASSSSVLLALAGIFSSSKNSVFEISSKYIESEFGSFGELRTWRTDQSPPPSFQKNTVAMSWFTSIVSKRLMNKFSFQNICYEKFSKIFKIINRLDILLSLIVSNTSVMP